MQKILKIQNTTAGYPLYENMEENFVENRCVELLRTIRWPGGIRCPRCDCSHIIEVGHIRTFPEHRRYCCSKCKYTFSDTSMTLFHGSRLPLSKWFDAIILGAKGSSAMGIKRELRITYKAAWRIKHLMREDSLAQEIKQRLLPR
ncbi:MAG: transposase [Deltaproteobacteria bacterium]|nr:transposase [Deltaproteobacteria bacterium]